MINSETVALAYTGNTICTGYYVTSAPVQSFKLQSAQIVRRTDACVFVSIEWRQKFLVPARARPISGHPKRNAAMRPAHSTRTTLEMRV